MAIKKEPDWNKAKALYGMGKTLRDIAHETNIPRNTIDRRAKSEAWSRTETGQKIQTVSMAKEIMGVANGTERDIIDRESDKILKAKGYIFDATLIGVQNIAKALKQETDLTKLSHGMNALKTARQAAGIDPIHSNQNNNIQVNVNSQQAHDDRLKLETVIDV